MSDTLTAAPRRSGAGLLLLALAAPTLAGYSYALNTRMPIDSLLLPLGAVGLVAVACYLWMRLRMPVADQTLYCVAVLLCGLGLVMQHRLDVARFDKQVVWVSVALVATAATAIFGRRPEKLAAYQYVCGLGALVLVLLPTLLHYILGGRGEITADERNGARLWIQFGGYFSLQPAEFAKILFSIFLAGFLIEKGDALADWHRRLLGVPIPSMRHAGPLLLVWIASLGLLAAQKDLGCALIVFCLFLEMLYSATGRVGYPVLGLLLFVAGVAVVVQVGGASEFSHVQTRIAAWLNPWAEPHAGGYQMTRSLFSLAQGDVLGTGIGRGLPTSIPEVSTDFVFSAIAEELGLVGACAVLLCFAMLVVRGFVASGRAKDDFCALLGTGLTAGLGTQAAIIVCGVTKFLPMTGVTLPFVSYGGSSIVVSGIALGLLIRISADPTPIPRPAGDRPRTRPLAWLHLAVFLALSLWLGYWHVVRGPALNSHHLNPRLAVIEREIARGRILDRRGEVLAEEKESGERFYPAAGAAAHVVGYVLPQYGSAGVEAKAAGWLLGLEQPTKTVQDLVRQAQRFGSSLPKHGYDVQLTLDLRLQKRGHELLAALPGRPAGAIAAINPKTGEVLCLVSRPTFDPAHTADLLRSASAGERDGREGSVFVNRATDGLYPPGSAFKILVAAAALDAGVATESLVLECRGEEVIHGDRIRCMKRDGHGMISFDDALIRSCNLYFAKLGDLIGPDRFVKYCEEFGFGVKPPEGFAFTPSRVPSGASMTPAMLLECSFGQGALQVTPLQMALIAGAIGNSGQVMRPQLVAKVTDHDGRVVYQFAPKVWRNAISPDAAGAVGRLMRRVVTEGTGRSAAVPGAAVAGKTGTAETARGKPHSWFACYAPQEDPTIAIAVVVEHGGAGASVAAPIARELLRLHLRG